MFNVFGFLKKMCKWGSLWKKFYFVGGQNNGLHKNIKYLYNNTSIRKNP